MDGWRYYTLFNITITMKLNFNDVKDVINYNNNNRNNKGFKFPLLPKLNNIIGNIQQGQTHVISGLPSAGTTSFIDQNYVISVLLQWYNTKPEERQKLKIFYYSMKDSELKKLQLLLCNYIKLVNGLTTDLSTLNNQAGKLYDLKEDELLQNAIEDSSTFFDEILDDEILVIKDKEYKPSDIYNDLTTYINTIGEKSEQNDFIFNDGYEDQITLVIVDSVDNFLPDNEGYGIITGSALNEKFQRYIKTLKRVYNISFVLAVPSITGYVRSPKDTEPHYRHLGTYGSIADKGICVYNPINEKNTRFYHGDEDLYISRKGSILMRTWHVVRNTEGIESVNDRMFFLPGTSYMIEYLNKEIINDFEDILDVLLKKTYFAK